MFLIMGITLYTSRVILEALGVIDFGIFNIVGSTIVLFSFFSNSLTAAIQRYLSFALGENNIKRFVLIFNQGLITLVLLSIGILLVSETLGLYILYNYIEIPQERFNAAFWIYQFSIVTFIFNILRSPYNASLIAHENMSFFAYIGIIEVILKLAIAYCIKNSPFDKLVLYGCLTVFVAFVILLLTYYYNIRYIKPNMLKMAPKKGIIIELINFSSWTTLTSFSHVISNQGVNILLNNFFGVIINAATGITNQIMSAYMQFLSSFQMAFNPQVVKSYASGDIVYFRSLLYRTSIFSFYLMLLITIPIIVKLDFILSLWLTIVPTYTSQFSKYIILSLLIESYSGPLWMAVQAIGNIKRYQIAISCIYLLNFIGGAVALYLGCSPISVFIIKIAVSICILFARLFLLNQMFDIFPKKFIKNVILRSIFIFIIIWEAITYAGNYLNGLKGFFLFIPLSLCFSTCVIGFIGFDKKDQTAIKSLILNYIRIKKNKYEN